MSEANGPSGRERETGTDVEGPDDFEGGPDDELLDENEVPAPTATNVLDFLVRALVDDPDAVTVEEVDGRRGPTLEVAVGPGDMGRVIGRRGRTAQAVRTLVAAAAVKDGVEVDVDFVD